MVLSRTLTLLLLLAGTSSFAKWEKITERWITAFDMLTPRLGLAAALDGLPLVMRIDNGREFGIINFPNAITSLIIQDKDVAYISVGNDGVYKSSGGWEFWQKILADANAKVVGVTTNRVFVQSGKQLLHSLAGGTFTPGVGIDTLKPIQEVVGYGDKIIAASSTALYYSTNGGLGWVKKADLTAGGTLYLDTVGGVVVAGGSPVLISRDSGKNWTPLTTPIFFDVSGSVYGTRDCSGTFYIVNDNVSVFEFIRSTDHGVSLQMVGEGPVYNQGLKQIRVVDRGSSIFWLDKEYNLYVDRASIDGLIIDSIASKVSLRADTGVVASACGGGKATPFKMYVGYTECTGIRVDNLTIEGNGFSAAFTPRTIGAGEFTVTGMYKPTKVGYDTARIRIIFRSLITNQTETQIAYVVGRGVTGPAELSLNTDNITYGILDTSEQLIKSVSTLNLGCDAFRIDSVVSTLPDVFDVSGYVFPIHVPGGNRAYFNVTFSPKKKQKYLESLVIYTSEGVRYVSLIGEGTFEQIVASVTPDKGQSLIELLSTVVSRGLQIRSRYETDRFGEIYTADGRPILSVMLGGASITSVALSSFSSGIYYLHVAGGGPPLPFFVLR